MPAGGDEDGGSTSLLEEFPCSKQPQLQQIKMTPWSSLPCWEALLLGESRSAARSSEDKFSPILSIVLILGSHSQSYFKLVYSCPLALESCP